MAPDKQTIRNLSGQRRRAPQDTVVILGNDAASRKCPRPGARPGRRSGREGVTRTHKAERELSLPASQSPSVNSHKARFSHRTWRRIQRAQTKRVSEYATGTSKKLHWMVQFFPFGIDSLQQGLIQLKKRVEYITNT